MIDELLEYAKGQFQLDMPVAGGDATPGKPPKASVGAHLRQVAKSRGIDPAQLVKDRGEEQGVPMECPECLSWYMLSFYDISRARTSNGFGPNPLTWQDVGWWSQLNGIKLRPWEVDLLMGLDTTWRRVWHDRSSTA